MAQNEQQQQHHQQRGLIEPAVLEDIINRLLEFRNARTVRQVQLSEAETVPFYSASREIFLSQLISLNLKPPSSLWVTSMASMVIF
ncbi:Nucleotide pyrophosphatase/phosphodiesterase [Datura stramonium]|uniref:Nucleotide pyrophosphatase/phosphodiesterase n=1 Tax=Datura stramonium TaxID=4076 RepID=A0ABS8W3Q6_DATST|nr:Nucleotide pyrophosphatase/phosphodiesterase [Datura stramonium]